MAIGLAPVAMFARITAALALLAPVAALGQSATEERLRAALRRTSQELAAAQAATGQQAAALAAATAERDRLQQQLAAQPAAKPRASEAGAARLASAEAARARAEAAVAERDAALVTARIERDSARATAEAAVGDRINRAERESQRLGSEVALCTDQNDRLFKTGYELATLYRDRGARAKAKGGIDVLGLSRAEVENLLSGYADRLYALRYPPQATPLAPTP
jgi:hypothetical protein